MWSSVGIGLLLTVVASAGTLGDRGGQCTGPSTLRRLWASGRTPVPWCKLGFQRELPPSGHHQTSRTCRSDTLLLCCLPGDGQSSLRAQLCWTFPGRSKAESWSLQGALRWLGQSGDNWSFQRRCRICCVGGMEAALIAFRSLAAFSMAFLSWEEVMLIAVAGGQELPMLSQCSHLFSSSRQFLLPGQRRPHGWWLAARQFYRRCRFSRIS